MVLLLTDGNGVDTYNDVYQLIQTQNAAMNNSLVFVTFGISQCPLSVKLYILSGFESLISVKFALEADTCKNLIAFLYARFVISKFTEADRFLLAAISY